MKKLYFFIILTTIAFSAFSQKNDGDTKSRILDQHNYYRSLQGAPDLEWDDKLALEALQWANTIAKKDQMIHSTMDWGENIFVASYQATPEFVVDFWADEQQFYNGEVITGSNVSLFGHYTQLIWAETTHVGCAEAVSKSGNHYWVCEYSPAGNYIEEKPVPNFKKQK